MTPLYIIQRGETVSIVVEALAGATDGTHPTAFGHKLDGMWYAQELRRLIMGQFG